MNEVEDESEFFATIVNITEYAGGDILKKDADTIYHLILRDYRKNISLAATQGLKHAYICIYEVGAKYQESIPIDDFIRVNNLKAKFLKFNIESVVDRLIKRLAPFKLDIEKIETDFNHDLEDEKIIIAIKLHWD